MRRFGAAAVASLALSLAACPPTAKVSFFNNTSQTVVVTHFDTARAIPPGEARELRLQILRAELSVYSRDGVREYALSLRDVPDDEFRNAWGGTFRTQLEPDGRIFLLKRGQRPPSPPVGSEQPPGFPLEPESGEGAARADPTS